MHYEIKYKREWVTYVIVDAESEDKAQEIFDSMLDNGDVYDIELDQCNIVSENIESINPLPIKFKIPAK